MTIDLANINQTEYNTELEQQLKDARKERDRYFSERAKLQTENRQLTEENNKLTKYNNNLLEHIKKCESTNASLRSKIHQLETEIGGIIRVNQSANSHPLPTQWCPLATPYLCKYRYSYSNCRRGYAYV